MMRVLLIILLLVSGAAISVSQNADPNKKPKPDFSGIWVRASVESDDEVRAKDKVTDYVMTIVHKEPELKIITQFKQGGRDNQTQTIYYTDGRPELNPAGMDQPQPFTGWRGKKLVRVMTFSPRAQVIVLEPTVTTVELELSEDGATLTRTTRTSGLVNGKTKAIFKRSS